MNIPFLKRSRSSGERHIRPNRDWSYILVLFSALLIIGVAWNAVMFLRLTRGQSISGEENASVSASAASVAEIHAAFEKRGAEAKKYREEYQFVDPSRSGG